MRPTFDLSAMPAGFGQALTARMTIVRALKVAAVVGTLLIAINHGDRIAAGFWPPAWKIALTYLVPYSVSSYSTAMFMIALARSVHSRPAAN